MSELENKPIVIEEQNVLSTHTKLPIIAQLAVLFVLMIGMFGFLFLQLNDKPATITDASNDMQPTEVIELSNIVDVPQKIENIEITASAAYVWDVREQRVLYSKNPSDILPLASITKLMTALLAHELVEGNTGVEVSLSAVLQDGDSGLVAGEAFTAQDLTDLSLIASSNDAAYALGANVGALLGKNDPSDQFVRGMNIRAEELGLTTMKFKNPTGLDISSQEAGAVGSARDVSFLMEYILENYPELLTSSTQESALIYNTEGFYHEVENTNDFIADIPGLLGSKTGYTDLAGGNLTVAFELGFNRPIIVTVLGSTRQGRFFDILSLIEEVQATVITTETP